MILSKEHGIDVFRSRKRGKKWTDWYAELINKKEKNLTNKQETIDKAIEGLEALYADVLCTVSSDYHPYILNAIKRIIKILQNDK